MARLGLLLTRPDRSADTPRGPTDVDDDEEEEEGRGAKDRPRMTLPLSTSPAEEDAAVAASALSRDEAMLVADGASRIGDGGG